MKFTKYNKRKRLSRTDADILACKQMLDDKRAGKDFPLSYYDEMSDKLSGNPSRGIYN